MKLLKQFIQQETVLTAAAVLAVVSAFFVPPDAQYLGYIDLRTLAILFSLMTVMAGLRRQGFFDGLGRALLSRTHSTFQLTLVLVGLCFFGSMFITNDVSLLTFVPFTFVLRGLLHQARPPGERQKRPRQLCEIRLHRAAARDDHDVIARQELRLVQAVDLAQAAAHAVALDGVAELGADGQAEAAVTGAVAQAVDHEQTVARRGAAVIQAAENMVFLQRNSMQQVGTSRQSKRANRDCSPFTLQFKQTVRSRLLRRTGRLCLLHDGGQEPCGRLQ